MKVRSTKVDAGDFKHELLNRLRSTMAVNVLRTMNASRLYLGFPAISNTHVAPVQRTIEIPAMLPRLHGLKVVLI